MPDSPRDISATSTTKEEIRQNTIKSSDNLRLGVSTCFKMSQTHRLHRPWPEKIPRDIVPSHNHGYIHLRRKKKKKGKTEARELHFYSVIRNNKLGKETEGKVHHLLKNTAGQSLLKLTFPYSGNTQRSTEATIGAPNWKKGNKCSRLPELLSTTCQNENKD